MRPLDASFLFLFTCTYIQHPGVLPSKASLSYAGNLWNNLPLFFFFVEHTADCGETLKSNGCN